MLDPRRCWTKSLDGGEPRRSEQRREHQAIPRRENGTGGIVRSMHLRSCQPQDDASDGTEWRQDSESRCCTTQSASTLCQLGRWQMLRTFEHAAWRRLVLLGRGDQDRLSLVACNVHPTPSARRLFPPDPCRREKEGSNGGCCWLRHVSTVAPWVDMSSTYDLPVLFRLVLPVQKRQTPPGAPC